MDQAYRAFIDLRFEWLARAFVAICASVALSTIALIFVKVSSCRCITVLGPTPQRVFIIIGLACVARVLLVRWHDNLIRSTSSLTITPRIYS